MRMIKHRREEFLLFDYAGVEKHLVKMAAKGWRLVDIEFGTWTYERMEPAKIRYSVTYIPTVSAFDPAKTAEKDRMDEYCKIAGWEKVADWNQMQIYCSEDPEAVDIETDESVRLEAIRKSMRKTFLVSNILLLCVFAIQGCNQRLSYRVNPVSYLSQNSNLIAIGLIVFGITVTLINLLYYLYWINKSKRLIAEGGRCAEVRFYRPFAYGSLAIVLGILVIYIFSFTSGDTTLLFLGALAGLFLIIYLVRKTSVIMRRKGVDQLLNKIVTFIVDIVLAIVLVSVIAWAGTKMVLDDEKEYEIFISGDQEWHIYQDEIPVKVEDLIDVDYEHASYVTRTENESILLKFGQYMQQSYATDENTYYMSMDYDVVEVKADFLYDMCLEGYLKRYDKYDDWGRYDEIDIYESAVIDRLYQMQYDGEYGNEWIICSDDLIIWLYADWELTEEEMEDFVLAASKKV